MGKWVSGFCQRFFAMVIYHSMYLPGWKPFSDQGISICKEHQRTNLAMLLILRSKHHDVYLSMYIYVYLCDGT